MFREGPAIPGLRLFRRGVVAASAGNHAQGVAYHGSLLGIPVTVVMPRFAALIKVTNCRQLGANVVLHGADLTEARAHAEASAGGGYGLTEVFRHYPRGVFTAMDGTNDPEKGNGLSANAHLHGQILSHLQRGAKA